MEERESSSQRWVVVSSRIAERSELHPGVVDAQWCLQQAEAGVQWQIFVDEPSPGSERLRASGLPVTTSPRRWVWSVEEELRSADELLARRVLELHREQPLDFLLYDAGVPIDLAWHEPELASVPRVVVADGALELACRRGGAGVGLASAWQLSGVLASADLLLSGWELEAMGLPLCAGPTRLIAPGSELDPTPSPGALECSEEDADLAVSALVEPLEELPYLLDTVAGSWICRGRGSVFLLLARSATERPELLEKVWRSAGRSLASRLVLVGSDTEPVAARLLEGCGRLVLASMAELAVPAVRDAVARLRRQGVTEPSRDGAVVLRPAAGGELSTVEPCPVPAELPFLAQLEVPRCARREALQIRWSDPGEQNQFGAEVEENGSSPPRDDGMTLVVDREPPAGATTLQLAPAVDLVLWGRPDGMFGSPSVEWILGDCVAVRESLLRACREELVGEPVGAAGLLRLVLRTDGPRRVNLLVVPGPRQGTYQRLVLEPGPQLPPDARRGLFFHLASCRPAGGPVIGTRVEAVAGEGSVSGAEPTPLFWCAADRQLDVLEWSRSARWSTRWRLALPWRWGLLDRGMRRHWPVRRPRG